MADLTRDAPAGPPILRFRSVDGSQITDALNTTINDINSYILAGFVLPGSRIYQSQFMQWLATVDTGTPSLVRFTVDPNPYSAVNIGSKATFVRYKDTWYSYAQTQLGYTDQQMLTGFLLASTFPITP